jgi:TolB-like protein
MKSGMAVVFLLMAAVTGAVTAKDNLAILPFTGAASGEGETIAELFSFSSELGEVFDFIPRTSITLPVDKENEFRTEGFTDFDTITSLGRQLGAKYVVSGHFRKLGNQNLLLISIVKIDDLRQVAGDIQIYSKIEDIKDMLPDMARRIIRATGIDTSNRDKLAVLPVELGSGVDSGVADTLAQILSINLTNSGKYAVYPRTATLDQVKAEYEAQASGLTALEHVEMPGRGANPPFVLSVAARRLGSQDMFNAAIINLESGVQVVGGSEGYTTLDDGIRAMENLARGLTGESPEADKAAKVEREWAVEVERERAVEEERERVVEEERERVAKEASDKAAEALQAAKGRLDGFDRETRGQFAVTYRKAEAAYREAGEAANRGDYEGVQQNIGDMDAALDALERKKNFLSDDRRFLSIGVQAGTWFTAPWLAFAPRFTVSVFPYTLFDIACDASFLHGYTKIDYELHYFSLYSSAHVGFFLPFDVLFGWGEIGWGLYAGAGVGWLYAHYKDDADTRSASIWALDATGGIYVGVGHLYFNIAYTLRTDFERINHKVSVGYMFRFN